MTTTMQKKYVEIIRLFRKTNPIVREMRDGWIPYFLENLDERCNKPNYTQN